MQDGILEWEARRPDPEALKERLHLDEDSDPDDLEELERLVGEAQEAAKPRSLFRVTPVTARGETWVELAGVRVDSALAAKNLADREVCAAYISTCGTELAAWAAAYRADPFLQFWTDEIMLAYLRQATAQLTEYLRENVFGGAKFSQMNPGSLKEWPITGQRAVFTVLGAREDAEGGLLSPLGVRLTPSCLMLPAKSVSGLAFLSDSGFVNCAYCPRERCPNRRAPYGGRSPLS